MNEEISSRKNKVQKNPWNIKNNVRAPKEIKKNETTCEEELDNDESKEYSYNNQMNDMSTIDRNSDGEGREHEDESIKHEKNKKEKIKVHLK